MANKPTKAEYEGFKKAVANPMTPPPIKQKLQSIIDQYASEYEGSSEEPKAEPKKRAGRKPATAKPKATKKTATDIEKAKAEIKAKTGKTEEECEAIIEQYRALRTKAQEGKRKAEQASATNKKRVAKLEDKGDLIEGTNVKTADAVIETTAQEVAEKIEQQIEAVEEKAEKEAKAEVAKDNTKKSPTQKKQAVEAKVEKKVKEKTKVIVKKVVIDTSALLTSIAESLGKFDKDSQKEFLIKLRSDIDKLLSKYAFGGMTDGATQVMNIQQSNLSSSSVNPTMFAKGGGVDGKDYSGKYANLKDFFKSHKGMEKRFLDMYDFSDDPKFKEELYSGDLELDEESIQDVLRGKGYDVKAIDDDNNGYIQVTKITKDGVDGVRLLTDEEKEEFYSKGLEYFGFKEGDLIEYEFLGDANDRFNEDEYGREFLVNVSNEELGVSAQVNPFSGSRREFEGFAKGGGVASRTKVEVGDEKIAIIKNRKEVKGYPVYVTSQGYAPITIGVYETKEKAEQKAMQIRKKNKYATGGVIGQSVTFDARGEMLEGTISRITNKGDYVVVTDDGRTILADPNYDVYSLGEIKPQSSRKKLFGFFDEGGNVSDLDYSDILAVLEDKLTDAVQDLPNDFENSYNATGEEVEHQSRDGFIAYTDGGYEVRWFEYLSYFYSTGYSLPTSALDKEKDRQIEYNFQLAKERFIEEYPEIVEELGEENIDYHSLYEAGYESEAEELSEMEMDFDGDETIMCEIGAYYYSPNNYRGIEGEHTLRLFGLVNLESPYHRSGNLEDRYDLDITFNSIEELEEKVEAGLKEIIDWFNGSHYDESTEELRIRRMAKGGLTEHGLRVGDKITRDFKETFPKSNEIGVLDENNVKRVVNLDRGTRMAKGGKLWIDTKGKGGLKGVKPSRKNSFRKEAVKRGLTSGQLASKVIANPNRYKGINPRSAQLVKNMGVRKHGGSIGDILRNRRGE